MYSKVIQLYMYLLFFFWLHWVLVAVRGLSLVVASGDYSSLWCADFSFQWLLLLRSTGSRRAGFSSCGMQAQELWRMGLVASRHMGSSRTRDWTHVPCTGRQILNHCATREVPRLNNFYCSILSSLMPPSDISDLLLSQYSNLKKIFSVAFFN